MFYFSRKGVWKMEIKIFQYRPSDFEETKIIQREFLSFLFGELNKLPWFNLDIDHELQLTMQNLDKFAEPDGRLFLVEKDGQIAATISLRKIKDNRSHHTHPDSFFHLLRGTQE